MSNGIDYTSEELALLHEHFPIGGAKACAKFMPGRSVKSISVKASKLGVKCPKRGGKRMWTAAEVGVLTDHYATGGMKAVRPYLPTRSDESIWSKVFELKLSCAKTTKEFREKMVKAAADRKAAKERAEVDLLTVQQKHRKVGEWKAEPVKAPRSIFEVSA
jgi:hypothetical protein